VEKEVVGLDTIEVKPWQRNKQNFLDVMDGRLELLLNLLNGIKNR